MDNHLHLLVVLVLGLGAGLDQLLEYEITAWKTQEIFTSHTHTHSTMQRQEYILFCPEFNTTSET